MFFWLSAFSVPFIKSIYYVKTRANDVKVSRPLEPFVKPRGQDGL